MSRGAGVCLGAQRIRFVFRILLEAPTTRMSS